jgi:Na+/melibiose symporter-like transporter
MKVYGGNRKSRFIFCVCLFFILCFHIFISVFIYYNHKPGMQWVYVLPLVLAAITVWLSWPVIRKVIEKKK